VYTQRYIMVKKRFSF